MQLATTFRHMDASPAVRDYAEDRLAKVRKYFGNVPISAHATFSVERGFNHVADFNMKLPNGLLIKAKETTEDMYSSIDLAVARIERQVRKWKERIHDHKPHGGPDVEIRESVFSAEGMEPRRDALDGSDGAGGAPKDKSPQSSVRIVREETFTVRPMRVEDAVMQMNLVASGFLLFTNVERDQRISVVYRRKDGDYGLIETGDQNAK